MLKFPRLSFTDPKYGVYLKMYKNNSGSGLYSFFYIDFENDYIMFSQDGVLKLRLVVYTPSHREFQALLSDERSVSAG